MSRIHTLTVRAWDGTDLSGPYAVTRKLDGVQLHADGNGAGITRGGTSCLTPEGLAPGIYEYFPGSWSAAMETFRRGGPVDAYYQLLPVLDERLILGYIDGLTSWEISELLNERVAEGDEGLVLWPMQGYDPIKVKPLVTEEATVTNVVPGNGGLATTMGALMTTRGRVGTGFTRDARDWWWMLHEEGRAKGLVIEVSGAPTCDGASTRPLTFVRLRSDR